MPDGLTPLAASALLNKGQRFFAKTRFHISYAVKTIGVDGEYAFVQATPHTATTKLATGQEATCTSQDFFVLRQESQDWKIYRYLFNSVREQ